MFLRSENSSTRKFDFAGLEMAAEDEKKSNFYAILGLKKECSAAELRIAYKTLALKWHPDRCAASGNSKYAEEAKMKFQAIQQAYSVLSDANKRFLYDVGVYDCNDHEDETGMGDFLNEMATMMSENNSNENGESFEEFQELFEEMFQSDTETLGSSSRSTTSPMCSSSLYASCYGTSSASNKRNSSETSSSNSKVGGTQFEGFCVGVECWGNGRWEKAGGGRIPTRAGRSRRDGRKQKISAGHDVWSS